MNVDCIISMLVSILSVLPIGSYAVVCHIVSQEHNKVSVTWRLGKCWITRRLLFRREHDSKKVGKLVKCDGLSGSPSPSRESAKPLQARQQFPLHFTSHFMRGVVALQTYFVGPTDNSRRRRMGAATNVACRRSV